jgi:hypothetical protein
MKVAVTGHTSGIGKACFEYFDSIGFSRSNGYDINNPLPIVEACKQADVFLNIAHGGFGQSIMLRSIFKEWQNEPKHIFNIGVDKVSLKSYELVHETYAVEKLAVHAMCEELQALPRKCKLTNVCLGYVENYGGDISFEHIIETIEYIHSRDFEVKRINIGNKEIQ